MLHGPFSIREARVDGRARLEESFRPGSVPRIEVERLDAGREGFAQPNG
jgi:hypothetical protein